MDPLIGLFSEASLNGPRDVAAYYRDLGRQIVLGDALGFDFFSTTQSYGRDLPGTTFSVSPNPLALFAAHVPLTRRIKILTGITIAPFHHPAVALSDFATVDTLSGGRTILGFGRGHPWLYGRLGYDQGTSKARTHEFLGMVRRILDDPAGRHTIRGQFWSLDDFELMPQFVQARPEVYVAVSISPSSALEAAEHGFGMLIPSYLGIPIEAVEGLAAAYRERHQALWGNPGRFLLGFQAYCLADSARAKEIGCRALSGQLEVFGATTLLHADKVGSNYPAYRDMGNFFKHLADPAVCRKAVDQDWPTYLAVWGDKAEAVPKFTEIIRRVRPGGIILNVDAGGIGQDEVEAAMRYIGTEILPALRPVLHDIA
jgi:alkanesulfonate monooxygenase SsuD/methylene tetrahydromethanopterin reductase-like flavin-dependent oxidoreductase (luciferase family)